MFLNEREDLKILTYDALIFFKSFCCRKYMDFAKYMDFKHFL